MITVEHTVIVGDTLTPMGVQLKQKNASGVLTPVDLTDKTVKFKMVAEDGTVVVAETTVGVNVVDLTTGKVQYDFRSEDVDTPGVYYGWFTVYSGVEKDTFPVEGRRLRINIKEAA